MFYHGVFILSVLMERIARMTKQWPMVLYPIHPTQQHITCSLIPMAAWTLHTTTPSLSQCACCNAYNNISLHHLPSIYENHIYMQDFQHYYFQMQTWMSSQRMMCVVLYISFSYIIPHQHCYDNLQYHLSPAM